MISRRNLISAFPLALLAPSLVRSQEVVKPWSAEAFEQAQPIVQAICEHPFLTGMVRGTLAQESFYWYLAQNALYLDGYMKALSLLSSKLQKPSHIETLVGEVKKTVGILNWTKDQYKTLTGKDISESPFKEPSQSVLLYSGFETQAVLFNSPGVGLAACLPCFWVYGEIGRWVATQAQIKNNPFQIWLDAYTDPSYPQTVEKVVRIADELADETTESDKKQMTESFLMACKMEWVFFDAAYRKEEWHKFKSKQGSNKMTGSKTSGQ